MMPPRGKPTATPPIAAEPSNEPPMAVKRMPSAIAITPAPTSAPADAASSAAM